MDTVHGKLRELYPKFYIEKCKCPTYVHMYLKEMKNNEIILVYAMVITLKFKIHGCYSYIRCYHKCLDHVFRINKQSVERMLVKKRVISAKQVRFVNYLF